MFIKNNSENTWKDYNCGGATYVTINAGETIEVDDSIGNFLLRQLGCEAWLVKVDKPVEKVKKAEVKVDKEEIKKMEEDEEKRKGLRKKIFRKDLDK